MARVKPMSVLADALDQVSLQWLNDNMPDLAEALEIEVENGATADQVRRFVMAHTQRYELALRMEQATRALGLDGN
jgi:hypothetical protein